MMNSTQFASPPAGVSHPGQRYAQLIAVLEACVAEAKTGDLSLDEILDRLGEASYSLIFILLSLPFLQPIALGPLSTVGGLNFAALGWQLLRGQQTPWLPDRVRGMTPSGRLWRTMLKICLFVIRLCERFTRPRWQSWVTGQFGERLCGSIVVAAGLLMAIPVPGVPLSNALPVLAILFIAIALLEQDGAMLLIALFWLLVTLLYFGVLAYAIAFLGEQALGWLSLPLLKS
jgi:hypothetical protein